MPKDDPNTTPRKILFARAWVRLRSKNKAIEEAGYNAKDENSKSAMAWELMQDPEVRQEIKRLEKLIERNTVMCARELDEHTEALMRANPQDLVDPETGEIRDLKDIPRELAFSISEYQTDSYIDKDGIKHVKRKAKLHNKKEVAELLMRRKNLLKGAGDGSEVRLRLTFGKGKKAKVSKE